MSEWQDISTAPKDGSTFLGYFPDGLSSDNLYMWPANYKFTVFPCRWKVPDKQSHKGPCWVTALLDVAHGVYDDLECSPFTADGEPTNWMPLPNPPLHKGGE